MSSVRVVFGEAESSRLEGFRVKCLGIRFRSHRETRVTPRPRSLIHSSTHACS